MTCPKCQSPFERTLMKNSVLIDVCLGCQGMWLDAGELGFLVKDRSRLAAYDRTGLIQTAGTDLNCPKCSEVKLVSGQIPGFDFTVEECSTCRGLYLDKKELGALNRDSAFRNLAPDSKVRLASSTAPPVAQRQSGPPKAALTPRPTRRSHSLVTLPSLGLTSLGTIVSMYALLIAVMVFLIESGLFPYRSDSI